MRLPLKLHPDSRSDAVSGIDVEVAGTAPAALSIRFLTTGKVDDILLPALAALGRADGLWQHTCFEAFVRPRGEAAYCELNLAPSRLWAAYSFDAYRCGMQPLHMQPPHIETAREGDRLELWAALHLPVEGPWQLALSAVIEEKNGRKSYWALAHPPGKADFHHPDSFVHEIP